MNRPNQQMTLAALHVSALATEVTNALAHLQRERHTLDGLPASANGSDNDGGRSERTITVRYIDDDGEDQVDQVPVTAVEAVVFRRDHLDNEAADLRGLVTVLLNVVDNIGKDCRRILATRVEVPRCDGGVGRAGHGIARSAGGWSDPSCRNVPDAGRKSCAGCRQRFHRWARENDVKINHVA